MNDMLTSLRLLDLMIATQADGTNPLDADASADLLHDAVITALIQDALALDYTDAELLALLAEVGGQRLLCTRCPYGTGGAMWLVTTRPYTTRDEPAPETLAMWRDARRLWSW